MRTILLTLLLAVSTYAQTTVWIRDGAQGTDKRVTGAVDGPSNTIRTTINGHGFSENDKINVDGVGGCYTVNGTRTVFAVVDANTVDLKGRNGESLNCINAYRSPGIGTNGAKYYTAAKLSQYTIKDPPNINGFDGLSGTFTTSLQSRDKVGNPAYDQMKSDADALLGSGAGSYSLSNLPSRLGVPYAAAMLWHAHGRSTCSGGTVTTRANGSKFCTTDATWEYLDMARWWINRAEYIGRGPGCDEANTNCARHLTMDQHEAYFDPYIAAFNIIYDQLTTNERASFGKKFLNNTKLNNSSETGCTNQYVKQTGSTLTGTINNTFAMIVPAAAAGAATVGQQIRWNAGSSAGQISEQDYVVSAVNDVTGRIDFTPAMSSTSTTTTWYTVAPFDEDSDCGYVWMQGHFDYNALWTRDSHPTIGGNVYSWQSNLVLWRLDWYMQIGAVTCPFDARGCELYERAQAYFYDKTALHAKHMWTGFTQSGSGHYGGRVHGAVANMANTLKSGLTTPIDLTGGVWLKRTLLRQIYDNLPGATNQQHFHGWGETSNRNMRLYDINHIQTIISAVPDTTEAALARYWLFNRFPYNASQLSTNGGLYTAPSFANIDPDATRTDYTTLSPQYLFQETDLDTPAQAFLGAYSRTGWGNSDTSVLFLPGGSWQDHWIYRSPGTYQIFKGNYLYADDRGASIGACEPQGNSCHSNEYENSSSITIGEPSSISASQATWVDGQFDPIGSIQGSYIEKLAWAGVNPTGVSSNSYTYLSFDSRRAANTSATGTVNSAITHYLHIKGGGRDYVIRYDDYTVPSAKRMKGQHHFPNNGGSGEGVTVMATDGTIRTATDDGTSMHTDLILPANVTDFTVRRTATNTLTINEGASVSTPVRDRRGGLDCEWTSPATVTLDIASLTGNAFVYTKSDCTIGVGHNGLTFSSTSGVTVETSITDWPVNTQHGIKWNTASPGIWGASGYIAGALTNTTNQTRRFLADMGTVTNGKQLILHQIHGNTTDTDADYDHEETADWQTVEVKHTTLAAIGALAKGTECKDSWSYGSTHSGTAQIVLGGLCAGNYQWTRNGGSATLFVVSSGDASATFDTASGTIEVTRLGEGPPITTTTLPAGEVGALYSATLEGVAGTPSWSIVSGALPNGLSLNSSSGEISGTPSVASNFLFRVRLTDTDTMLSTEKDLSINIASDAPALSLSPPAVVSCTFGLSTCSGTPTASGGTSPYTFEATGLPTGLTINPDGTWNNNVSVVGDFNINLTVTDSAMAEEEAPSTVIATVSQSASDYDVRRLNVAHNSCLLDIALLGLDNNATIYGSLRLQSTNAEIRKFEIPAGPARRTFLLDNLDASTNYVAHLVGDGRALYQTFTTLSAPVEGKTFTYQIRSSATHIRIQHGSTPLLGTTSSISPCADGNCVKSLSVTSGPLWFQPELCSNSDCSSIQKTIPKRLYMVRP